jgi:hypothetical protein
MKYSFFLAAVGTTILALLAAGCTAPSQGGAAPVVVTTTPGASPGCGFTTCHGLDLACGRDPPQVCTADYQLGDKCHQYAYCSQVGDTCSLITNPQFDTCKRCVELCGGADSSEILLCEEKC